MKDRCRTSVGFTLIELLVVVVILGVLMAIAIPDYFAARETAKVNAADANTRMITGVIQTIYVRNSGSSYAIASDPSNFAAGSQSLKDLGGQMPTNPCTGGAAYGTDYVLSNKGNPVTGVTITALQGSCSRTPTGYSLGTG